MSEMLNTCLFSVPLADQAAPVGNATVSLSNVSWQHWIQWYGNSLFLLYVTVGQSTVHEPPLGLCIAALWFNPHQCVNVYPNQVTILSNASG